MEEDIEKLQKIVDFCKNNKECQKTQLCNDCYIEKEEILDEINFCNEGEYITREHYQAIQGLLNLYKQEKERNKELQNALVNMVNQFADTDKEEKHLYTMGLSALENAFTVLNIDEGIRREDLWKKI